MTYLLKKGQWYFEAWASGLNVQSDFHVTPNPGLAFKFKTEGQARKAIALCEGLSGYEVAPND